MRIVRAAILSAAALASAQACLAQSFNALLFTKTAGFRHDSIPAGVAAVRDLAAANCFGVTHTEDAGAFTAANLAGFDVVVFLNTTGDVLNASQEAAMQEYVAGGGGFVGVHSASDTEHGWPFYGQLVGAWFSNHPAPQNATIHVEDPGHLSTGHLPEHWARFDEWYNFMSNPRPGVRVLATLDESTYTGGTMGSDHPIAWCHDNLGGRSWYTAGGHTIESYGEPDFRRHLLGGILWAAGRETLPPCSDYNCDGLHNPDDLSEFITCFFLEIQFPGFCPSGDFNGDGLFNPDDLSEFITAFFLPC